MVPGPLVLLVLLFSRNYTNSNAPDATIRNNIFYNARITPFTTVAINNFPVTGNWNSSTSDYNLFYCTEPTSVGFWGGVVKTFAEWKTSSGGDANSLNSTVSFVNISDDLHLTIPGNCHLDGAGVNVLSVSDDIDAQIRNALTPDIGADEFSTTSSVAAAGIISGLDTVCAGDLSVAYSVPLISGATQYNWTLPPGASIASGLNTNSITVNFSGSASSGTISVYGTDNICDGLSSSFSVTVNSVPQASNSFSGTSGAISIVDNGVANPYPSTISVGRIIRIDTGCERDYHRILSFLSG